MPKTGGGRAPGNREKDPAPLGGIAGSLAGSLFRHTQHNRNGQLSRPGGTTVAISLNALSLERELLSS